MALFPNLRSLVLIHDALVSNNCTVLERQWRHAQLADEIMRVLVQSGSSVDYVHFRPSYPDKGHDSPRDMDANGHTWPNYSYRRGAVSFDAQDCRQFVQTVAVPVNFYTDPLAKSWES